MMLLFYMQANEFMKMLKNWLNLKSQLNLFIPTANIFLKKDITSLRFLMEFILIQWAEWN